MMMIMMMMMMMMIVTECLSLLPIQEIPGSIFGDKYF
jgi:hypothetical protein